MLAKAAAHFDKLKAILPGEVLAVELPGLGASTADPKQQTLETHIAAVVAGIDAAKNPVVLLGHSLAGVTISGAAEARSEKIKCLVFLAAETRPGPGWMETAASALPSWAGEGLLAPMDGGMMGIADGKLRRMAEIFFSGAPDAEIDAAAKLLRPQPPGYKEEALVLSDAKFGKLRKAYIKTLKDEVNLPVHQDTWISRLGSGVATYELDSGHGPFISAPESLAEVLKKISKS